MKKTAFLCLILAAALTLSACSLVVKDPEVDAKRVIVSVNGNEMHKQRAVEIINTNLSQQQQLAEYYKSFGMAAPEINQDEIIDESIKAIVRSLVLENKGKELKLDVLSAEEEKKLEEDSNALFEDWKRQVKEIQFKDSELKDEELDKALVEALKAHKLDMDVAKEEVKTRIVNDKLKAETVKDVSVADEEAQAEYDTLVEKDKTSFEANPDGYGESVNRNDNVYFVPGGYRMVKQILIKFLAEDKEKIDAVKAEITPLESEYNGLENDMKALENQLNAENLKEEDKAKLNEQKAELGAKIKAAKEKLDAKKLEQEAVLKAAYSNIKEKADNIYNVASSKTKDFDELVKEHNEDTGMPAAGYPIREGYKSFDKAFVDPAMALKNIGDVAKPSEGVYGYYIVQYADDIKEGPVAYESVSEKIRSRLLNEKQNEFFENSIEIWTKESKVDIFRDRLFD